MFSMVAVADWGRMREALLADAARIEDGEGRALLEWLTPAPEPAVPRDALAAEDAVGTHWVRPEILVDVTHLGRSAGGRLRQPAYTGLRLDIAAREDDA